MKYLGVITNDFDLVNKKYVDDASKVIQTLTSGTEIGSVGGVKLYAPQGGSGGGDMYKSTYDTNNSGVVDNAEALGGVAPSGYSKATNISNHLDGVVTDHYYSDKKDGVAFEQLNDGSEGNYDTGMRVERADTEVSAFFGIGTGGNNHGIFSNVYNRWMIYDDTSGITKIPGNLKTGGTITDGTNNILSNKVNKVSSSATSFTIGGLKFMWGSVSINLSSGSSGSGTHDTPYRKDSSSIPLSFSGVPYVWVTIVGSWTGSNIAHPIDVTATSMKIRLLSSAKPDNSKTIRWLALGKA